MSSFPNKYGYDLCIIVLKNELIKNIKSKIVSCMPAEANTIKTMLSLSGKNQIVSRETIYTKAKEGETFCTKEKGNKTVLI